MRRLASTAATLLTGVAVVTAVAVGVLMHAGYRPLTVLTGSMEPGIATGALVLVKPVAAAEIRRGDVITFDRPDAPGSRVTHRVAWVGERGGARVFRTKGDANRVTDPWTLRLPGTVGRYVADVPHAGRVLATAGRPEARAALIALMTLSLLFAALRAIWRPAPRTSHA